MSPATRATSPWPGIERAVRAAKPAHVHLFLDFDGTLSSIVRDPAAAALHPALTAPLRAAASARHITVTIVSGRPLTFLRRKLPHAALTLVGNHGYEMAEPGKRITVPPAARRARPLIKRLGNAVANALHAMPGIRIEDKGWTVALHVRRASPKNAVAAQKVFWSLVRDARRRGKIRVATGKKVLEIRPPGPWNKGAAVRMLLAKRAPGLVVYAGDDVTDEDAFRALGKRAVTVKVGTGKTRARFRIKNPAAMRKLLLLLLT